MDGRYGASRGRPPDSRQGRYGGRDTKSYQESRRTSFTLDDAELEIDEWSMISPYLEIEGRSPADVYRVAALLGYREDQLTSENTTKISALYGIDMTTHKRVSFDQRRT